MSTVFYSWQSDAPNNTNRSFIEQALRLAIKDLKTNVIEAEREDVELTQDTEGVPGTPDIAATIFAKIESCDVFVCDVSLVLDGERAKGGKRPCPNPNVMLELGYAMKAPGQERILMVCNTALGRLEDLPFDLRGKRPVAYFADASSELPECRKAFAKLLTLRITEILRIAKPTALVRDAVDVALEAIAVEAGNRKALVRAAMEELLVRLDALNLPPETSLAPDDELFRVWESSKVVHERFFVLLGRIEEFGDGEALDGVIHGFRELARRYYVPTRHSGVIPEAWFELYYATGRLWLLLATAALLRHQSWDLLRRLLATKIQVANPREYYEAGRHSIEYLNHRTAYLLRLGRARGGRLSLFADLLKAWTEESGSPLPPMESLIDADLLLGLWHGGTVVHWWPETIVHADRRTPPLIHELRDREFVYHLTTALGLTVEELRENAGELKRLVARWISHNPIPPLSDFDPAKIASS